MAHVRPAPAMAFARGRYRAAYLAMAALGRDIMTAPGTELANRDLRSPRQLSLKDCVNAGSLPVNWCASAGPRAYVSFRTGA
jgi:hypothetical protein